MRFKCIIKICCLLFIEQFTFGRPIINVIDYQQFKELIYVDSTNSLKINSIRILLNSHKFKSVRNIKFNNFDTYWLYIKLDSDSTHNFRVIQFLKPFSHIELYPFPFDKATEFSGELMPSRIKKIEGNNIVLRPDNNEFLVKIKNNLLAKASVNDIKIINEVKYFKIKQNKDIFQGTTQGILWFMLIYNLFFLIYTRKLVYFHYVVVKEKEDTTNY